MLGQHGAAWSAETPLPVLCPGCPAAPPLSFVSSPSLGTEKNVSQSIIFLQMLDVISAVSIFSASFQDEHLSNFS